MDFIDQVRQFSKRAVGLKDTLQTEEATKTAVIMPFFSMLGYDVFNPEEFTPEFVADVGIKKGEKVDYAIMQEGEPVILVEAKWIGEPLLNHDSQLFRYFGTTSAKFGILTNGLVYRFYTDLDTPNKMDLKPFLEIDVQNIKETQVSELKKFQKSNFDLEEVINTASELRYSNAFKQKFTEQLQSPSEDFVRFFLIDTYDGVKTQNIIDKFTPVLKKALNQLISEMMNDKIKTALTSTEEPVQAPLEDDSHSDVDDVGESKKIITTQEEIEAFALIRNLLQEIASPEDISIKDTESYCGILYKNNSRKWICRLYISDARIALVYPDEEKKPIKETLESIYDLNDYKEQLVDVVKRYQED